MSAVNCLDCGKDYLLPEDPTATKSNWKCLNSFCRSGQTVQNIVGRVYQIEDYVDRIRCLNISVQQELELLQRAIGKYSGILVHKNHYALQDISTRILQLLVECEESILNEDKVSQINSPNLELFITHCKYLLDIGYLLVPAMTGYIGKRDTSLVLVLFYFNFRYFGNVFTKC